MKIRVEAESHGHMNQISFYIEGTIRSEIAKTQKTPTGNITTIKSATILTEAECTSECWRVGIRNIRTRHQIGLNGQPNDSQQGMVTKKAIPFPFSFC
jgi:hypothetical protein